MLQEGSAPNTFREAIAVSVNKKGCKTRAEVERNVFLTSPCCKLFESAIVEAIMKNANAQQFLCVDQFVYRSGRSCDM